MFREEGDRSGHVTRGAHHARHGRRARVVAAALLLGTSAAAACAGPIPEVTLESPDAAPTGTASPEAGPPGSPAADASGDVATSDVSAPEPDAADASDASAEAAPCTAVVATDPRNCGVCGHDCQGGLCKAGVCQPFELVASRPGPFYIAVDDTRIYWADRADWQIVAANKNDGSNITVLADAEAGKVFAPWAIVLDDTNIYWANGLDTTRGGGLRRLPKVNSTGIGEAIAEGEYPRSLALHGNELFFAEHEHGTVRAIEKTATDGTARLVGATQGYAEQLVVDGTNVFWTDSHRFPDIGQRVVRAPKTGLPDGGVPPIVVGDQVDILGLAQDDTNLFFTRNSGPPADPGSVRMVPKTAANGAGMQILAASTNPTFVAVSNGEVFWAEQGMHFSIGDGGPPYDYPQGRLMACKLPGCAGGPREIARMQPNMQNIVATPTAVYWTNYGLDGQNGWIMKVVR